MRKIMVPVIALTAIGLSLTPTAAHAATTSPKPVKYANCTALNKVYPHGVAKAKSSKDKVKGKTKPATGFTVNAKVYQLNSKLDRDKDTVACEKR